jgi:hypothetical protein
MLQVRYLNLCRFIRPPIAAKGNGIPILSLTVRFLHILYTRQV